MHIASKTFLSDRLVTQLYKATVTAIMAANLRDDPELRPFVLSNVQLTGIRIGGGAYGRVDEVAIPVKAAAKTIYPFLQEPDELNDELPKAATEFVRECRLMSTLRHPHIVQFLGVFFSPGSQLPALVMERLLTSLHDLLAPETHTPLSSPRPLFFFNMDLKCSVLQDVANGLAYLHEQPLPIIHRDLSARNVLLNSDMVAKISDLGMARILPRRAAATLTKGPGAMPYMPPEAIEPLTSNTEMSKYDTSIDIFSFGVITIFTIGETFPCDPLIQAYIDEKSGLLVARTELQRRSVYMQDMNAQLRACGQFHSNHPLIRLVQKCLQNLPSSRPGIREVLHLLKEANAGVRDRASEINKRELVQALHSQSWNQVKYCTLRLAEVCGGKWSVRLLYSARAFQRKLLVTKSMAACLLRTKWTFVDRDKKAYRKKSQCRGYTSCLAVYSAVSPVVNAVSVDSARRSRLYSSLRAH